MSKAKKILQDLNTFGSQIEELARAKTADELNETSLNRIYKHYQDSGETSFAILTAFRGGLSREKNWSNYKTLTATIRAAGLGFIQMTGHGQEEQPDGTIIAAKEPSLFVPGMDLDTAQRLSGEYDQTAFVYAGPDTDGEVWLYSQDSGGGYSGKKLGAFHPQKVAQFFSAVKGKPFVFENRPYRLNWADGIARQAFERAHGRRNIPGIDS